MYAPSLTLPCMPKVKSIILCPSYPDGHMFEKAKVTMRQTLWSSMSIVIPYLDPIRTKACEHAKHSIANQLV